MAEPHARQRWIAHVDLDAFFASCEQRERPAYRGRPVVVGALPGHRGVVAAASYEARRFGIHSAMPIAEAHRRCPRAVFLAPDMEKYRRVSQQVLELLAGLTPCVEAASIDEAYLDVSGLGRLLGPPEAIGAKIKRRILTATGLTASVGLGPNRLIAKLGSEHRKPDGLTVVAPEQVLAFLAPMPVSNLRGLGRRTQQIFARLGIATVAQLRAWPPAALAPHIGNKAAASFHRQTLGIASDEVVPQRPRKSLSRETTFETDVRERTVLRDTLRTLASAVAAGARREGLAGAVVTLKIRFADFETHTRRRTHSRATRDEREIFGTAWQLLSAGDLPERPVRLIGVGLSGWQQEQPAQADLFAPPAGQDHRARLLQTLDDVRARFGEGVLQLGAPRRA